MQLTQETVTQYQQQAPALMESVTHGEAEWVMKRDPATDHCVKFDQGWCGIQREYGEAFLGDACYFYPRITRALGETVVTTAALSCPEAARLMLTQSDALAFAPRAEMREPFVIRNSLPGGLEASAALAIHQQFLEMATDESITPERALMRISAVARGLEHQPVHSWAEILPLYIRMADSRIPRPEAHPADLIHLAQAFYGLVMASPYRKPALLAIIAQLADALGVHFGEQGSLTLAPDAAERGVQLLVRDRGRSPRVTAILRRYLTAQVSQALFPFALWGGGLSQGMTVLGVRYATVKYALAAHGAENDDAALSAHIARLARFFDHLGDPTLSLAIYTETGWVRESRLRALIGDA